MRSFHTVTAVLEVAVGLGKIAVPSLITTLLLSAALTAPLESAMARIAGVALGWYFTTRVPLQCSYIQP
jgi:hypothetical protein